LVVYVVGTAMAVAGEGAGVGYVDFAMPGMFAMTMAFGFMNTAFEVTQNKEKGFMDRFRSMPMSSSAVVTGRGVADVIHASIDLLVIVALALVIGWRPEGSPAETLFALGLLLWLRLADLRGHLPGPADPQHRGRRKPVRRGVPARLHLVGVRAAGHDARVARRGGGVEPRLVHGQRDPRAVPHAGDRGLPDQLLDRRRPDRRRGGVADRRHGGLPPARRAAVPQPQQVGRPVRSAGPRPPRHPA